MDFSLVNEVVLSIILGLVQGVTEFLPISSTAHVFLLNIFATKGRDVGVVATNILQLGTLGSILIYFWSDLSRYLKRLGMVLQNPRLRSQFQNNLAIWWNYPESDKLNQNPQLAADYQALEADEQFQTDVQIGQIAIATVPIVIAGALLLGFVDSSRSVSAVAGFLVVGALLMGFAEWIHNRAEKINRTSIISKEESVLIGLFQVLALLPGMSRSGSTISGALFMGRDRAQSVRFSFLISIPALFIAGIVSILQTSFFFLTGSVNLLPTGAAWTASTISLSLATLGLGLVISFVTGYLTLRWLVKYLSSHTFLPFIIYRILLAVVLTVYVLIEGDGLLILENIYTRLGLF
jgi:undecaprenyl-diphosphatase